MVPTLTIVVSLPCCCCDLHSCREVPFFSVGVAAVVHTYFLLHSVSPACPDLFGLHCLLKVPCCASIVWHAGAGRGRPRAQVQDSLALSPHAVFCHGWCALRAPHSPTPCPRSALTCCHTTNRNKHTLPALLCSARTMGLGPCAPLALRALFVCIVCVSAMYALSVLASCGACVFVPFPCPWRV